MSAAVLGTFMAFASMAVDYISFGWIDSWIVLVGAIGGIAYGLITGIGAAMPLGWVLTKSGLETRLWVVTVSGGLASVLVFLIWEAVVYSTSIDVTWWPVTRLIFVSAAFLGGASLAAIWQRDWQRLIGHNSNA